MLAQLVLPGDNPDVAGLMLEHECGAISNLTASYASASEYYMMNVYGKDASAYYDVFSGLRHLKRGETKARPIATESNDTLREELEEFVALRPHRREARDRRVLGDAQSRRHQGGREERARGPCGRRRRDHEERRIAEGRDAMPRIDIGELALNVEERGSGPAFIFIPGLVGLLNAWEFQMAEFSKRYRCISFDHRGAGDSDKPKDAYATRADRARRDRADGYARHRQGACRRHLDRRLRAAEPRDRPSRPARVCIFSNTWVKADEYITRVQMTRKRIALAYGPEEYVKVSSLFTNGAMQFRYDLDKVMELERRALKTVAPVEVLAGRLDMTLGTTAPPTCTGSATRRLIVGTRDDATVPFYQSEDLHKAVAGSRLVIVEEGGHYSYRHWQ